MTIRGIITILVLAILFLAPIGASPTPIYFQF